MPIGPQSVDLFYSYAHGDETLCQELQKHLAALKRAGLISDWYDRKIDPGSAWAPEIQRAMERAGLILLLISADFIASKYIFDIELPFALERQRLGLATVIPVLLRPVEWHDLPFAALQMLPSKALPVTSWPNTDQAFYDIALRLRELIYGQRQSEEKQTRSAPEDSEATRPRQLDAAMASSVVLDEPVDVVAMLRTTDSGGLRAILRLDRSYSPDSEDVKSKAVEIEFPRDPSGKVLAATLGLALVSPGFDPPSQKMQVRVPALGDSDVFVFMLTPKRAGTSRVTLQVLLGDVVIATQMLVTKSVTSAVAEPTLAYNVVSMPVGSADLQGPRMMPAPAKSSPTRSNHGLWIGIGTSAAALALVSTTFFIRPGGSAKPADASRPATAVEQPQHVASLHVTLSRLQEQTKAAEETSKRAGLQNDQRVVEVNARLRQNIQKADQAIRAKKAAEAQTYVKQIQVDLATLHEMTSHR